jgi:hypothetical protein
VPDVSGYRIQPWTLVEYEGNRYWLQPQVIFEFADGRTYAFPLIDEEGEVSSLSLEDVIKVLKAYAAARRGSA